MKFLPILNTLSLVCLMEIFLVSPKLFFWLILAVILLNYGFSYWLTPRNKHFMVPRLTILPNLIVLSMGTYVSLLQRNEQAWLIQFFILLLGAVLFLYWRYHYLYFYKENHYQSLSIENLSFWVNFLISYYVGASAYGLMIVLGLSWWKVLILVSVLLGLLLYQNFWVCDFKFKEVWPDLLIAFIALIQLFFGISWLPLHYNSLGLLWATSYYVVVGLIYSKLSHKLTKDKIKLYTSLAIISMVIILISSRWI